MSLLRRGRRRLPPGVDELAEAVAAAVDAGPSDLEFRRQLSDLDDEFLRLGVVESIVD
jgi:hypothetical protein